LWSWGHGSATNITRQKGPALGYHTYVCYGISTVTLEALLHSLSPCYDECTAFLNSLDHKSATLTLRLEVIQSRPAREVVEEQAHALTAMLDSANQTALTVCATTTPFTGDNTHYMNRGSRTQRVKLSRKLHIIKAVKGHLSNEIIATATTVDELIDRNRGHATLLRLAQDLKALLTAPLHSLLLRDQLNKLESLTRTQIKIMDEAHNKQCRGQARQAQQKKISKHPKEAHKDIFNAPTEENQSRAGLKAVEDPISKKIETEPEKIAAIIEDFFRASLKAVRPKTGEYQPSVSRDYPWVAAEASTPDRFTLHTPITLKESKGEGSRPWLHSCILDKAAFHECIHNLGKNKSHGPDGSE